MAAHDPSDLMTELSYGDPRAALDWLAAAFGCTARMLVANPAGQLVYAEAGWGDSLVAVVPEQPERLRSPKAVAGVNTQSIRVRLEQDIEAHCERARAAGAVILQEPVLHFFGDHTYRAADLEGHVWAFSRRVSGAGGAPPDGWTVTFPGQDA